MARIKAGIIGGAGYTAGELIRLLINHPNVDIAFIQSSSNAGEPVGNVHEDLFHLDNLVFTKDAEPGCDVIFLCKGHGESVKVLESGEVSSGIRIIDLSQDFRIKGSHMNMQDKFGPFIYGLPELNREEIQQARNVANPGCFATCIELGLLPLAASGWLINDIHTSAITGSTGAGQKLSGTSHFSWRKNNMSVYKALEHQHLLEIRQTLEQLQRGFNADVHFIPYRGNFTRGIIATSYTSTDLGLDEAYGLYTDYYGQAPFVSVSNRNINLKQVVNTNFCQVYLEKHKDKLVVVSIIDNLLKGASGQAVQNMNLMFGLNEKNGLQLKASAF